VALNGVDRLPRHSHPAQRDTLESIRVPPATDATRVLIEAISGPL
jgi:hypothetical protein